MFHCSIYECDCYMVMHGHFASLIDHYNIHESVYCILDYHNKMSECFVNQWFHCSIYAYMNYMQQYRSILCHHSFVPASPHSKGEFENCKVFHYNKIYYYFSECIFHHSTNEYMNYKG